MRKINIIFMIILLSQVIVYSQENNINDYKLLEIKFNQNIKEAKTEKEKEDIIKNNLLSNDTYLRNITLKYVIDSGDTINKSKDIFRKTLEICSIDDAAFAAKKIASLNIISLKGDIRKRYNEFKTQEGYKSHVIDGIFETALCKLGEVEALESVARKLCGEDPIVVHNTMMMLKSVRRKELIPYIASFLYCEDRGYMPPHSNDAFYGSLPKKAAEIIGKYVEGEQYKLKLDKETLFKKEIEKWQKWWEQNKKKYEPLQNVPVRERIFRYPEEKQKEK